MGRKKHRRIETGTAKGKQITIILVAIILAGVPFVLGKYIELNSPGPFDSAANVYSAKHILDGAEIGVQERPSAQLGTLLMNILGVWVFGFNDTGPKVIQGILQGAALVVMFYSMRKLFGSLAAVVSVFIASAYLSAPVIAKFGNVKEQFMIAFMVLGVSCFVLRQLQGRWWWALLAGGFLAWAPLFKETGTTAIGAVGLFVIVQPLFKHRTPKQTGVDILLLVAGAVISLGPLYIWIIGWDVKLGLPYSSIMRVAEQKLDEINGMFFSGSADAGTVEAGAKKAGTTKAVAGYVAKSRIDYSFTKQALVALRYYKVLILPISLAAGALLARFIRAGMRFFRKRQKTESDKAIDRFVLLFGIWWILDMSFVWISPRPYEQYYLPLNASGAMLGGYLVWLYSGKYIASLHKGRWVAAGVLAVVCMAVMSQHIFFGLKKSPFSATTYPQKRRGYAQSLQFVANRKKGNVLPWEVLGKYIRDRSDENDTIYVWGWYAGIYVKAQRLSSVLKAFESEMHVKSPYALRKTIEYILRFFAEDMPKFIVDSRHKHFPYDRPPLELWPIGFIEGKEADFLPLNDKAIAHYDAGYSKMLAEEFGEKEAKRYREMGTFRKFVMDNYRIAGKFGSHVLFELKKTPGEKGKQ